MEGGPPGPRLAPPASPCGLCTSQRLAADRGSTLQGCQKLSLAPNWITRVVMPETPPPIAPNVAERMLRSTVPGSGLKLLNRLKNSERNSNDRLSLKRMVFVIEKSTVPIPGSRIASVLGAVPNRPNGVCPKPPVL